MRDSIGEYYGGYLGGYYEFRLWLRCCCLVVREEVVFWVGE